MHRPKGDPQGWTLRRTLVDNQLVHDPFLKPRPPLQRGVAHRRADDVSARAADRQPDGCSLQDLAQLSKEVRQVLSLEVSPRLDVELLAADVRPVPLHEVAPNWRIEAVLVGIVRRTRLRAQAEEQPVPFVPGQDARVPLDHVLPRLRIRQAQYSPLLVAGSIFRDVFGMLLGEAAHPREVLAVILVVMAGLSHCLGRKRVPVVEQRHIGVCGHSPLMRQPGNRLEVVPPDGRVQLFLLAPIPPRRLIHVVGAGACLTPVNCARPQLLPPNVHPALQRLDRTEQSVSFPEDQVVSHEQFAIFRIPFAAFSLSIMAPLPRAPERPVFSVRRPVVHAFYHDRHRLTRPMTPTIRRHNSAQRNEADDITNRTPLHQRIPPMNSSTDCSSTTVTLSAIKRYVSLKPP